jgi:hypothetical protein
MIENSMSFNNPKSWQNFGAKVLAISMLMMQACGSREGHHYTRAAVEEESLVPQDICITSQYTPNQKTFSLIAVKNHSDYAAKYGYQYFSYGDRISGDQFLDPSGGDELRRKGLYWQKVTAVEKSFYETDHRLCKWTFWLDSDILITNQNLRLEKIIQKYSRQKMGEQIHDKSLILPKDESGLVRNITINNGAFFLKNNEFGKHFIESMKTSFNTYKNNPTPEQDAFQDFAYGALENTEAEAKHRAIQKFTPEKVIKEVALVPQRAFDSFYRGRWRGEFPDSQWHKCDFIAHFSGIDGRLRVQYMNEVLEELKGRPCAPME